MPGLTGKLPHRLQLWPPPGFPSGPSLPSPIHSRSEDRRQCGGGAGAGQCGPALHVEGKQASTRVIRAGGRPEDSDENRESEAASQKQPSNWALGCKAVRWPGRGRRALRLAGVGGGAEGSPEPRLGSSAAARSGARSGRGRLRGRGPPPSAPDRAAPAPPAPARPEASARSARLLARPGR